MIILDKFELEFTQRPIDVPADLRLYRRLAMVCISVSACCFSASASFKQIHFINTLMIDEYFRSLYLLFKKNRTSPHLLTPSLDPYLNRCVNYALGAELLSQKKIKDGFKVSLTPKGVDFLNSLKKEKLALDIFTVALEIGRVSEREVDEAMKEGL